METSLHRQLKLHYAGSLADTEVSVGCFRVDAVRDDELIEIQCASLSAIRSKAERLLQRHRLRIVKPVIVRRRITRLAAPGGEQLSRRLSPKRGSIVDLFDELIYFTRVFPHPNLIIEALLIDVEQIRVPRRRRRRRRQPDYLVHDVTLESIQCSHQFRTSGDLLDAIGWRPDASAFNTAQLATVIDRPRWFAQKVAYVLRHAGAIEARDRNRDGVIYGAAPAA